MNTTRAAYPPITGQQQGQNSLRQKGVSLIEVMITLFVLTFGVLAIGNLQTDALIGVNISSSHFMVNTMSQDILEQLKADSEGAAAGVYNTNYSDTGATPNAPAGLVQLQNYWKTNTAQALSSGEMKIDCNTNECLVSVRWNEMTADGFAEQTFNLKSPI